LIIQKQDESYTLLISENESDKLTLQGIHDFLKAEKPDARYNFKIQRGWESPFHYFSEVKKHGNQSILRLLSGHLDLIKNFNIPNLPKTQSEFTEEEIDKGLKQIISMMPFEPYDYQLKIVKDSLLNPKQMSLACTSAGKSCAIFMIMYFLYTKNKIGLVCVPNISLTTQIYGDFKDYFHKDYAKERDEFLSNIQLQGGGKESTFDTFLTITTWQSLLNRKEHLSKFEFILCDEVQRYASDEVSQIIKLTNNAKYKWGVTGTLPEDPLATMNLIGMFGFPKRYIRACELIERGLGTPVEIISFIIKYNDEEKRLFNSLPKGQYAKQLAFIKEHQKRNEFVSDLIIKVKNTGNTIVLGSHTQHIKDTFIDVMKKLYPDVEVQNKDITGKKSFEFQKQYGVYFINGEDNAETRELTRKILEEKHYIIQFEDLNKITLSENEFYKDTLVKDLIDNHSIYKEIKSINLRNEILISNYQILSAGVNIRRLFNLIFISPLKAYTTITQSIGRGLRLHPDKKIFRVFDLTDDFGIRKPSGIFYKQYEERKRHSYNSEGYPITEKEYNLS
jgi:superfamily II DNA or RNA helicase